jgi:multidrug efflux pump subunit AcrB
MQGGPSGAAIALQVTGEHIPDILAAAEELKQAVARSAGTYDINDDFEEGRREIRIELLDSARPLGLTTRDLATEVRGAFYGLEARTLQRGAEDIDIRVRFPPEHRRSIYDVESMRVATPSGEMVPFVEVARISEARGYSSIHRVDQRRAVVVEAGVDESIGNAEQIIDHLGPTILQVQDRYPGMRISFAGAKRETMKSLGSLKRDFLIALGIIFVMLAGLFKSYSQPLVVLGAVPFGLNGAIFGHWLMGYPLTVLSMIGIVALTGIVVNDSLILVDTINKELAAGTPVRDAVLSAARRRLRPIILTSLTTILGLAPLMLEQSFQARFLIPMAISISFGLLFATVLTLVVVPALFILSVDVKQALGFKPREELIAQAG